MSSSNDDPHPQGGSLTDMAVDGTTVPEDAARPNHIPSKARPGQGDGGVGQEGLGAADLASAADNQGDIARSTRDDPPNPDAITGTGDSLPDTIGTKNLQHLGNADLSKGHGRYDKHVRQKGSDIEQGAVGMGEDEGEQEVRGGVVEGKERPRRDEQA